ncbi:hypothetical protein BJY52DRAFT_1305700, partial [Lactarius psammicola]
NIVGMGLATLEGFGLLQWKSFPVRIVYHMLLLADTIHNYLLALVCFPIASSRRFIFSFYTHSLFFSFQWVGSSHC